MISPYHTRPPLPLGQGSAGGLLKQLRRIARVIAQAFKQVFVSYNPEPEPPATITSLQTEPSQELVEQCKWLYEQAEDRRNRLEQKAQWAFGIAIFLFPLMASAFVYLLHLASTHIALHALAIALLMLASILLLLAFISVLRAISIRPSQTLFLDAVIDSEKGSFRSYSAGFHARGLLFCTSVNTGINDHIAQFVRGANILTVLSVTALVAAAVPAAIDFAEAVTPSTHAVVSGELNITSSDLTQLRSDFSKVITDGSKSSDEVMALRMQMLDLEARMQQLDQKQKNVDQPQSHHN